MLPEPAGVIDMDQKKVMVVLIGQSVDVSFSSQRRRTGAVQEAQDEKLINYKKDFAGDKYHLEDTSGVSFIGIGG